MKCNVCNAELRDDQSFCAYCGTKVENESDLAYVKDKGEMLVGITIQIIVSRCSAGLRTMGLRLVRSVWL